jgi:metal-responsive CopG/Arc/MetJ family transcriptional regulator
MNIIGGLIMRINAVLSDEIVQALDSIAQEEKKSRSQLLREGAEKIIAEYEQKLREERRRVKMQQAMLIQDRLREKSGTWDGVAEIRKWREKQP